MARFLDGPVARSELLLRRCPEFLRVVVDETDGTVDALDQLDDTPSPAERIHVYRMVPGTRGGMFLCGRGRGPSGPHQYADYRYEGPVEEELVRESERWRRWCEERVEAESTVGAT